MARDPYQDEPSAEELAAAAGAGDWFNESLAEQRKRDAKLKANLGQDATLIKAGKNKLMKDFMDLPPDTDPEAPPPDLFASERAAGRKKNADLSSIMGDLESGRKADKDLLKDLFGK